MTNNQILSWARFNLTEKDGEADRKVPLQPLAFLTKDGQVSRYNLRKVTKNSNMAERSTVQFMFLCIK